MGMRRSGFCSFVLALCLQGTGVAWAAEEASSAAPPPPAPVIDAFGLSNADTAWMLVASALVLMMTAPGLALFYGGLVRKKNILGVMMQCIFLMGMMSVVWALWGYSLAFGGNKAWIGTGEHLLMKGVQAEWVEGEPGHARIPMHTAYGVPVLTY